MSTAIAAVFHARTHARHVAGDCCCPTLMAQAAGGHSSALTLPVVDLVEALTAARYSGTTVSITFDDGVATQHITRTALQSRGMSATYYVGSGLIGRPAIT